MGNNLDIANECSYKEGSCKKSQYKGVWVFKQELDKGVYLPKMGEIDVFFLETKGVENFQ
jgi:hypothetical protein